MEKPVVILAVRTLLSGSFMLLTTNQSDLTTAMPFITQSINEQTYEKAWGADGSSAMY